MTCRSLPCPDSAMTEDWAGGGCRWCSPGIKDQEAGEGRDSYRGLIGRSCHCGRRLSRRATVRQWGSRKAVWVPELSWSPHRSKSIRTTPLIQPNPSWREARSVGQDLWGRPPRPLMGVWDFHPEALAWLTPRDTREHQLGSFLEATSMEEPEIQRREVMVSCGDSRAP